MDAWCDCWTERTSVIHSTDWIGNALEETHWPVERIGYQYCQPSSLVRRIHFTVWHWWTVSHQRARKWVRSRGRNHLHLRSLHQTNHLHPRRTLKLKLQGITPRELENPQTDMAINYYYSFVHINTFLLYYVYWLWLFMSSFCSTFCLSVEEMWCMYVLINCVFQYFYVHCACAKWVTSWQVIGLSKSLSR